MNEVEEMPEEVLLDAWYTKYENARVYFPLIRRVDVHRIILSTPLMTAMWRATMQKCNINMWERGPHANQCLLFHYGSRHEYAQYVHVSNGCIRAIELRYKGV